MTGNARYRLSVAVLLQLIAVLFLAGAAHAKPTNIRAELVAEHAVRPGETVMLAIHMQPADGWHGYWLNPGDAGLGMKLDWTLPPGARPGEPQYPVPSTLLISGLMNHVYKGDYAVLVPLTVPEDAKPGAGIPVELDAQWLACTDEICVPEEGLLETTVHVGGPASSDSRFEAWRAKLPAPLNAHARFERTAKAIRLAIPLPAATPLEEPHVFVAQDRAISYAAPQRFSRNGNTLVIELERPRTAPGDPDAVSGILRLNKEGMGLSFDAIQGSVPPAGELVTSTRNAAPAVGLPLLLLGALVGGLLLNIMPCVFPILSLKALSLARAGESEAHARIEGMAYTAGVVVACLGLGALLLVLRAGGEQVGWAFQLQEPGVIAVLLLLATAITANFLGLFELNVPGFAQQGSPQSAFATGLLAAFVATPCTGPFMAAAMGAALLLPPIPSLTLFATLGLGIALPFVLIAFVPPLRRRMPRPGAWMTRFRRWMALPMGLTALALLWLASRVGGATFALAAGSLAVALLVIVTFAGRRQRIGKATSGIVLAGMAVLALAGFALLPRLVSTAQDVGSGALGAQAFNEQALARARAQGKPVFVWMTADWCITCKVNEQVAIDREDTARAFRKAGVIVLRGDWTRRDPEITRYLTAQGAAGVPFYMWYPADGGNARQLPQVLTQSMLVELSAR